MTLTQQQKFIVSCLNGDVETLRQLDYSQINVYDRLLVLDPPMYKTPDITYWLCTSDAIYYCLNGIYICDNTYKNKEYHCCWVSSVLVLLFSLGVYTVRDALVDIFPEHDFSNHGCHKHYLMDKYAIEGLISLHRCLLNIGSEICDLNVLTIICAYLK